MVTNRSVPKFSGERWLEAINRSSPSTQSSMYMKDLVCRPSPQTSIVSPSLAKATLRLLVVDAVDGKKYRVRAQSARGIGPDDLENLALDVYSPWEKSDISDELAERTVFVEQELAIKNDGTNQILHISLVDSPCRSFFFGIMNNVGTVSPDASEFSPGSQADHSRDGMPRRP